MKVAVDLGFVKTICLYRSYETPNYFGDYYNSQISGHNNRKCNFDRLSVHMLNAKNNRHQGDEHRYIIFRYWYHTYQKTSKQTYCFLQA